MNDLTRQFLEHRHIGSLAAYHEFDTPTTALLDDIDQACWWIEQARAARVPVLVIPDFDCDGIMSGTVLGAGLAELGLDVSVALQDTSRGYGISPAFVAEALAAHPGTRLAITSDTGVNETAGIHALHEAGVHVIVTDHHIEEPPRVEADVVVDPCAMGSTYPDRGICGAAVAQLVLERYATLYQPALVAQMRRLRLFAAIGTMSDSMPLVHGNRQLVRDGVGMAHYLSMSDAVPYQGRSAAFTSAFTGAAALLSQVVSDHPKATFDEELVSFYVAPELNVIKRLGRSTSLAYDLMFGSDAPAAARVLADLNERRKDLTTEVLQSLSAFPQPFAPWAYVTQRTDVGGMLGLVASHLVKQTAAPVLVLARDPSGSYHGSGRAPDGIDARSAVNEAGGRASGHAQAFGCHVPDDATLAAVTDEFALLASQVRAAEPLDECDFWIGGDTSYDVSELREFVEDLEGLHPFGPGFEAPSVAVTLTPDMAVTCMGHDKSHLKVTTTTGLEVVCWGQAAMADRIRNDGAIAIGKPSLNRWNGFETVQVVGSLM